MAYVQPGTGNPTIPAGVGVNPVTVLDFISVGPTTRFQEPISDKDDPGNTLRSGKHQVRGAHNEITLG